MADLYDGYIVEDIPLFVAKASTLPDLLEI
jgi:hypothetical protein